MNETITSLPVIFRAEKRGDHKGEITAVFPTLAADMQGNFTVYAHIGQHGAGTLPWYWQTRAAKPDEYAPLLAELRGIYERALCDGDTIYKLQICQRFTSHHRRALLQDARRA